MPGRTDRAALAPLAILPAPFDTVAARRVGRDRLVAFEDPQHSVRFAFLDRRVEVRVGAGQVQVLADQRSSPSARATRVPAAD